MIRRTGHRAAAVVVAVGVAVLVAVGGCGADDEVSNGSAAPSPTQSETVTALEEAQAGLMASAEVPLPGPNDVVEIQGPSTAEGDQVGAPWRQFMLCSTVQMPDEGPPITAEPGAAAGAWAFGQANTVPDEPGYTQIDQYAITYVDQAAATAALERSEALTDDCDAAIETWATPGMTWTYEDGTVPSTVEGFRLTATFTADEGASVQDEVSAVMRSGRTVLYLRFNESSGGGRDGLLDPGYVDQVLDAAAASLTGAAGTT